MEAVKILIVKTLNISPERKVNERIKPFVSKGYVMVSATTAMVAVGEMNWKENGSKFNGIARHIYYVTTVVLKIPKAHPAEFRLQG